MRNFVEANTRHSYQEQQETIDSTRDEIMEEHEKLTMKKLFKNRVYFVNSMALAVIWGASGYSFYFTEFYMKYVPFSNLYLLAVLMGLSDLLTSLLFRVLIIHFPSQKILTFSFGLMTLSSLTLALCIWVVSNPSSI